MGKANDIVKVSFGIPNTACKHYSEPLGCERDNKFHTCCQEECGLTGVMFGFDERYVKVHHEFKDGKCIHCGDEQ